MIPPVLEASQPPGGTGDVPVDLAAIGLTFSEPVTGLEGAVSIEPAIGFQVTGAAANWQLTISGGPLAAATTYKVVLGSGIADLDATPLEPTYFLFSTGAELGGAPDAPHTPVPADGTADVIAGGELAWQNGEGTGLPTPHDVLPTVAVYLSKDKVAVTELQQQALCLFDPGPIQSTSQGLSNCVTEAGETYYWRVLAANQYGQTVGPVWQLTTQGGCVPSCSGLECGDDGCGGSCGECGPAQSCEAGTCTDIELDCCAAHDGTGCVVVGECQECVCGIDDFCCASQWDDACAGIAAASCGDECGCECVPQCDGAVCGSDGCGGSCGECPEGQGCASGACIQVPADCCSAAETPGCATSEDCQECVCGADDFCCTGQWDDLCAQAATTGCAEACECQACVPDCAGKLCGADGCGGSCGECAEGLSCVAGVCAEPNCCDLTAIRVQVAEARLAALVHRASHAIVTRAAVESQALPVRARLADSATTARAAAAVVATHLARAVGGALAAATLRSALQAGHVPARVVPGSFAAEGVGITHAGLTALARGATGDLLPGAAVHGHACPLHAGRVRIALAARAAAPVVATALAVTARRAGAPALGLAGVVGDP